MSDGEQSINPEAWEVEKIAVAGPGIVGMPMAAMLAHSRIHMGHGGPAEVVIVQRNSPTSGWKVEAINNGNSVIGGVEPELDRIVEEAVSQGLLRATHDYTEISDADVVLVCVQTDKKGVGPDYGPMMEALTEIAEALGNKPKHKLPLLIFESTLAPSTMTTIMTEHFRRYGLKEGRDILLGNSPNRVMPGRLVERIDSSDKIVAGLSPVTPELIRRLYSTIVTQGRLYPTNSLTAEVIKTLENAYRDVRIAFAAEIARFCDEYDINFFQLRDAVNERLNQADEASCRGSTVPTGGLLVPTVGVGGHCLPKDGILLWWRRIEVGEETSDSLIMESRRINDESPIHILRLAESVFGDLAGRRVALLGTAYRFNSEDTRNSPTLSLARHLLDKGAEVTLHDPYVKPEDQNLVRYSLQDRFSRDIGKAMAFAEIVFMCTAHDVYLSQRDSIFEASDSLQGIVDGCNIYSATDFPETRYVGVGRGKAAPTQELIDFVYKAFRIVETGTANEVQWLVDFLNRSYAPDEFNHIDFSDVQRIAGTCVTGCAIVDPGPVDTPPSYNGFTPRLVQAAHTAWQRNCLTQQPSREPIA
jgi:UDP-N-acetyl-D-mannosaminuronic acid dehydrogenase